MTDNACTITDNARTITDNACKITDNARLYFDIPPVNRTSLYFKIMEWHKVPKYTRSKGLQHKSSANLLDSPSRL